MCCNCALGGGAAAAAASGGGSKAAAGLLERSAKRADRAEAEVRKLRAEVHALRTSAATLEARAVGAEAAAARSPESAMREATTKAHEAEARALQAEEETLRMRCELQALRAALLAEGTEKPTGTTTADFEDEAPRYAALPCLSYCCGCLFFFVMSALMCPFTRCGCRRRAKVQRMASSRAGGETSVGSSPVCSPTGATGASAIAPSGAGAARDACCLV